MSSVIMPFPFKLRSPIQFDPVLVTIVLTLLLGGLVILASASISISDGATGHPFLYVEKQLLAIFIGMLGGGLCLLVPMHVWQSLGPLLLLLAIAFAFRRSDSRRRIQRKWQHALAARRLYEFAGI